MTSDQAQAQMMAQLGIQAMIPGPSGDENAPNHANYDEALANPFPTLPDPLTTNAGRKVTTADQWWKLRRPEIVEGFEREVYGRVPATAPRIRWTVTATDRERIGFTPVIARRVIGHADNAAAPGITVDIRMVVVTPANAKGPVPLLILFGRDDFPAPSQPTRTEFERIDAAIKKALVAQDPGLAAIFAAHPAYPLAQEPPFRFPERDARGDLPRTDQLIAAGWGYALLDPGTIQPDSGEGLTEGVIGLSTRGQPRKPDDWGVLRAWGWGASRALDYLATDPTIDAARIGVEGVSRYGKAALVAAAFDERFAVVLVGSSGKGGATLLRRNFGEAVASLTGGEHYWMAGNFLKYGAAKADTLRNAGDLPVDSHELIALVAPRAVFLSYGIPEQGDARWLDQRGSFMAAMAAGPVFELLGVKDLGVGYDYRAAVLPPVNSGLLDGRLAWRQHDGGHTDQPNMRYFIPWADRQLGR
ncbi:acetyl xylan esterase [Sphingomonas hengshuiensis]|uniref:Acetyl xylan esterase n=2 Tax=Sphingomonas hengshuiensis TaxID=1609977 RepID=A0A7U5HVE3_9SPHN|nr:acetyl xylan esterase [Sphingomonas hengshuiensis]